MIDVEIAYPFYPAADGTPLQLGSIYYGVAGQNPVNNPATAYWDANGTQPTAQPIRVVNGQPTRNGMPARVYISGDYSKLVVDSLGRQVSYEPNQSLRNLATLPFTQAGIGAASRDALSKARERVSIMDFAGVVGDGVHDDTAGILAAIAATSAAGGGILYAPRGVLLLGSSLGQLPANVTIAGEGKNVSVLKRAFSIGPVFTGMAPYSGLRDLSIDGGGYAQDIVTITGGISYNYQTMQNVRLLNTSTHALSFAQDSGAEFRAIGCNFMTTGTLGVVGAVATLATDTQAVPRHFIDCAGEGSTLYDFSGANDTFVHGGYSNGIITNSFTSKLNLVNFRVGAAAGSPTIAGANLNFQNVVFATPVVLTCVDSIFNCIVPDWDVTDNGTGNSVFQRLRSYAVAWTGSVADPAIGNGTLQGYYSRQGAQITVQINLSIGSTTTFGNGGWRFSLPQPGVSPYSLIQVMGSGFTQLSGAKDFVLVLRTVPGQNYVELFYVDVTGALQQISATTQAWAAAGNIRFSFTYLRN